MTDQVIELPRVTYSDEDRYQIITESKTYCSPGLTRADINIPITEGGARTYTRQDAVNAIARFLNRNNIGLTKNQVLLPNSDTPVGLTATRLTQYLVDVFYGTPELLVKYEDIKSDGEVILFLENIPLIIQDNFLGADAQWPLVLKKSNEFAPRDIPYLKQSNDVKPIYEDAVLIKIDTKLQQETCADVINDIPYETVNQFVQNVRTPAAPRARATGRRASTRTPRVTQPERVTSTRERAPVRRASPAPVQEEVTAPVRDRPVRAPVRRTRRAPVRRATVDRDEVVGLPVASPVVSPVSPRASPRASPVSPRVNGNGSRVSPRASPRASPVSPGVNGNGSRVSPRASPRVNGNGSRVSPRASPVGSMESTDSVRSLSISPRACPTINGNGSRQSPIASPRQLSPEVIESPPSVATVPAQTTRTPVRRPTGRRARVMRNI